MKVESSDLQTLKYKEYKENWYQNNSKSEQRGPSNRGKQTNKNLKESNVKKKPSEGKRNNVKVTTTSGTLFIGF
jgi:hypothetical protein